MFIMFLIASIVHSINFHEDSKNLQMIKMKFMKKIEMISLMLS